MVDATTGPVRPPRRTDGPQEELNAAQRAVVGHGRGPLLVLGGPGSGKTTVLLERFVALARAASADRVLLLVPNRATKVALQQHLLRRLLFDEGIPAVVEVPVYTWHGLAYHLVSRNYDRLAYAEPPVLLTSPEQWSAVREALAAEDPAAWPHHGHLLSNRGFVDEVVDFMLRCEQALLEDDDLDAIVRRRPNWAELVRFVRMHRSHMRDLSRVDYPTLLRDAAELIARHDDVRDQLQRRFTHILVDDGQELASVQVAMLRFLGGFLERDDPERSLVVAADPDSSIEHFRGADPGWLGSFATSFGPHDTVTLPETYRLGEDAFRRAVAVVQRTSPGLHRPLRCAGAATLEAHRYATLAAEAEAVARLLREEHLASGTAYEDMAILMTSPRAMLPVFERALDALQVPYTISAPDRPLEREAVVRAFIELARHAYGERSDERLRDLLRGPLIGLEPAAVRELERAARVAGTSLCDRLDAEPLAGGQLTELCELLRADRDAPADAAFFHVWERSHAFAELRRRARSDLSDPANRDLDALVAFARALGRFVERRGGRGTLPEYLEAVGRADFGSDPWLPPERRGRGVEVLSFHAARGREWDVVAVCGAIEGAIPKGRRAQGLFDPYLLEDDDPVARIRRQEAEDRRVFYVALTRARRRCVLTMSPGAGRKALPSRYVGEVMGEIPQVEPVPEGPPLTLAEAAARARRELCDPGAPPERRVAALALLQRVWEADPTCRPARPEEWWWRWERTEGAVPIHAIGQDDVPPGKVRTSYTRLSRYDNCPLQYLYDVVMGLDPEVGPSLHFGRWIHEIIEDCEREPTEEARRLGRRHLRDWNEVVTRYEEVFDPSVFPHEVIARQHHADGLKMLANYWNHVHPRAPVLCEHSFRMELDGHVITGRIDRVDKRGKSLVVSDFKTSRRAIGYDEARRSLQLALYYRAAQLDPELAALGKPVSMQLVYPFQLSRGTVTKRCQEPDEAEEVLEGLPALLEGVANEVFAPSPEADCTWCRFKPICPLWPEGRELQP